MSAVLVTPVPGPLHAVIEVPGSKSVANRALICAMLAEGQSVLSSVPSGDDTQVIVDVLQQTNSCMPLAPGTFAVTGHRQGQLPGIVDAKLAGTSSRFLTAVAALGEKSVVIDGGEPLRSRPMEDLHSALNSLGVDVTPLGNIGHLPVAISRGSFEGGAVSIRGDVSSQFISALMLIAPVLPKGLHISIEGHLVSRSYVQMTAQVMHSFGASVETSESSIVIAPGSYVAQEYRVEPDFSSAAFPLAAVAIRGGEVRIPYLATSQLQGDSEMLTILENMGVSVRIEGNDIIASREDHADLRPLVKNMEDCSDLVPAVAMMCAVAQGESHISGIGFIRNKESDRIGDLSAEMKKAGVQVQEVPDGLSIVGVSTLTSAQFAPHHDHRLAMSLALSALSSGSCVVEDAEVVTKSWPTYFSDMSAVLGTVQQAQ